MDRSSRLGSIALGLLAVATLASTVVGECSREKLIAAADGYLAAQKTGKLGDLQKLFAGNFVYQENNKVVDISKGILNQALTIDYNRTTADTVSCATYTQLAALTPKPYVIGTQLHYTSDMSAITTIDSIVATTGALFFNASATLGYWRNVSQHLFLALFHPGLYRGCALLMLYSFSLLRAPRSIILEEAAFQEANTFKSKIGSHWRRLPAQAGMFSRKQ